MDESKEPKKYTKEELMQMIKESLERPNNTIIPDDCQHNRTVGDNYGVTCMDCGVTLKGYGYWAEGSKVCIHEFLPYDDKYEICGYCEQLRPKPK